jgi:hypothetical protein
VLRSCALTRLAYTTSDGSPRVIPIGYTWTGTTFLMHTVPHSAKVSALTGYSRVALTIDTDTFPPNVLLVRGSAVVQIIDGVPPEYLDAGRRYIHDDQQYQAWEAGVRGLYKQMARIVITPDWVKILDFENRHPQRSRRTGPAPALRHVRGAQPMRRSPGRTGPERRPRRRASPRGSTHNGRASSHHTPTARRVPPSSNARPLSYARFGPLINGRAAAPIDGSDLTTLCAHRWSTTDAATAP